MSLTLPGSAVKSLVDKHAPHVLKRHITDRSLDENDWKKIENIRVICRFRPPNRREQAFSKQKNIPDEPPTFETEQAISLSRLQRKDSKHSPKKQKPFKCVLDSILDTTTTQKQVFYLVGQPMILSCLEGFNSTIFAYGQSGSGKTFTMFGPEGTKDIELFGLVPRCFIYLFQKLNKSLTQNGGNLQDYTMRLECLQIYKRDLLDLLNPNFKGKLVIKTDFRTNSIFVQSLRSIDIKSIEEAFAVLTEAQSNRIVAGHALNSESSRSHMLVMVSVIQRHIDGSVKRSKLNFGDLAGCEDLTKALGKNPDPERRQEAIAINSSLSALTTAINYLSKGKKPGYRDSPLTHILKDSLGGNSKTVMFVACSPHIYNRNETIRALRFAACAKKVKNKAKKNEEQSVSALKQRIKELEMEVAKLSSELLEARSKQKLYKKNIKKMHDGGTPNALPDQSTNLYAQQSYSLTAPHPRMDGGTISPKRDKHVRFQQDEETSPLSQQPYPRFSATASQSITFAGMVKVAHADNDEWSGSDDEDVFSDEETGNFDDLLRDDDNEEELNYIHEISELRRKLQDAFKANHVLSQEIYQKNVELEQCENHIAKLTEEADAAQHEVIDVRRQFSTNNSPMMGPMNTNPNKNLIESNNDVPEFSSVDGSSDSEREREGKQDNDDEDDGDLPPIPNTDLKGHNSDSMERFLNLKTLTFGASGSRSLPNSTYIPPHIVTSVDDQDSPSPPYETRLNLTASTQSINPAKNVHKMDKSFSFNQTNTKLLEYLAKLQTSVLQATEEMKNITNQRHAHFGAPDQRHSHSSHYSMSASGSHAGPMPSLDIASLGWKYQQIRNSQYSDESSEDMSSTEDDEREIIEREKKIESALNKSLTKNPKKGSWFSCFFGGEEDEDDDKEDPNETSMLVEEYLKAQVRKEMLKEKQKMKNKTKKKRQKKKDKLFQHQKMEKEETIYSFDEEMSILTTSPTHSMGADKFNLMDDDRLNNLVLDQIDDSNVSNVDEMSKKKRASKKYAIQIDSLGDSTKNIVISPAHSNQSDN